MLTVILNAAFFCLFMGPPTPARGPTVVTESSVELAGLGLSSTVSLVMTTGRRFRDDELWCGGQGLEKLQGRFSISVRTPRQGIVVTDLSPFFGGGELWFTAAPWVLKFADYNHDGRLDFTIGQHGGCAGWTYRFFTINPAGVVEQLPVPDRAIWSIDGANSSALFHVTPTGFRVSRPGSSATEYFCAEYAWSATRFILSSEAAGYCPEDDPDKRAP